MNTIHPTAVVGPGVELGSGNVVGPGAVLIGPLVLGDDNWLGPGVVIGTPPEIRGHAHPAGWDRTPDGPGVVIGSRNVLRELVLVHQGSARATTIGDDCFVMNKVYVAHDDVIGDGATLASSVTMGGHVQVGPGANIGMGAVVHQRRVIGPGVMVGMGSVVTRDVPPFAKAYGTPARVQGGNVVGMTRAGVPAAVAERVHAAYGAGRGLDPRELGEMRTALEWWERATASAIA